MKNEVADLGEAEVMQTELLEVEKNLELYMVITSRGLVKRAIDLCYGQGVKQDRRRAIALFRKASRLRFSKAQYCLGICHLNGWGVVQNIELALELWEEANDHYSLFAMGLCHFYGVGVCEDIAMAFQLFERASDKGNIAALNRLEFCSDVAIENEEIAQELNYAETTDGLNPLELSSIDGDDDEQAMGDQLNSEALSSVCHATTEYSQNDICDMSNHAQYILGRRYFYGLGVEKNGEEAVKWLEDAAVQIPSAAYLLGKCYELGFGVQESNTRACEHYGTAAERGHAAAHFRLGVLYYSTGNISRNYELAVQHFKNAASLHHAEAMLLLGMCLENGEGGDEETSKAVGYYKQSMQSGCTDAIFHLALCYYMGNGVSQNVDKVIELLQHPMTLYDFELLANCYENRNMALLARNTYQSAANFGSAQSRYCLAKLLMQDGQSEILLAIAHMQKAANNGCTAAIETLAKWQEQGMTLWLDIIDYYEIISENPVGCKACEQIIQGMSVANVKEWFLDAEKVCDGNSEAEVLVKTVKDSADNGNMKAQCFYALMHLNPCYNLQSSPEIVRYLTGPAEKLNEEATTLLPAFCEHELEEQIDNEAKRRMYMIAVEEGSANAEFKLGLLMLSENRDSESYNDAISWIEKSAKEGFTPAILCLGKLYEKGKHISKDEEKAFLLFQEAAKNGDAEAQFRVANCYFCGKGVEKDILQTAYWLATSEAQGFHDSALSLAHCYEHGLGVKVDLKKAFELYFKAGEAGSSIGFCLAGVLHCSQEKTVSASESAVELFTEVVNKQATDIENTDARIAFETLNAAVKAGSTYLSNIVADCYFYGIGIDVDYESAAKHYESAAQWGDIFAKRELVQCYVRYGCIPADAYTVFALLSEFADDEDSSIWKALADCYYYGIGTVINSEEAAYWYVKAFEKAKDCKIEETPSYLSELANFYFYGRGTACDYQTAFSLYTQAANLGDASAAFHLAKYYRYGLVVLKDKKREYEWLQKAASKKHGRAMYELAECHYYGEGTTCNYEQAIEYYALAAEAGIPEAAYSLQFCCHRRNEQDAAAKEIFRRFLANAENGDTISQYLVGYCFEHKIGTENNLQLAQEWYEKAAANDNAEAMFELAQLYASGMVITPCTYTKGYWDNVSFNPSQSEHLPELSHQPLFCDYSQAFTLLTSASRKLHTRAMKELANMYQHGLGCQENQVTANQLRQRANLLEKEPSFCFAPKYDKCHDNIGEFEQEDANKAKENALRHSHILEKLKSVQFEGVKGDQIREFEESYINAVAGSPDAQFALSRYYRSGWGIKRDKCLGEHWRATAAEAGCVEAILQRADSFFYGKDASQNLEEAAKWYRKIHRPSSSSLLNLAKCLESSSGGKETPEVAEIYLTASAALCSEIAAMDDD